MKQEIYSIRDAKADNYGTPFFMNNEGLALRAFNDLAQDESSTVHNHPEDFSLYHIGIFDSESGEVKATETPKFVANAPARKQNDRAPVSIHTP